MPAEDPWLHSCQDTQSCIAAKPATCLPAMWQQMTNLSLILSKSPRRLSILTSAAPSSVLSAKLLQCWQKQARGRVNSLLSCQTQVGSKQAYPCRIDWLSSAARAWHDEQATSSTTAIDLMPC